MEVRTSRRGVRGRGPAAPRRNPKGSRPSLHSIFFASRAVPIARASLGSVPGSKSSATACGPTVTFVTLATRRARILVSVSRERTGGGGGPKRSALPLRPVQRPRRAPMRGPEFRLGYVFLWDPGCHVDLKVGFPSAARIAARPADRFGQHFLIETETDQLHMAGLCLANEIAGAAKVEITRRDRHAGADAVESLEGREPLRRVRKILSGSVII